MSTHKKEDKMDQKEDKMDQKDKKEDKASKRIERTRQTVSEIARELRRLRASPFRIDDGDSLAKGPVSDRPVMRVEQLELLRLTRHRIIQLLVRPAFEQAVTSCFVRVNIKGHGKQPEYRIAEIMGTQEQGLGYLVDGLPTNVKLRLRYGGTVTPHELTEISNMAFTLPEFQLWYDCCLDRAIATPTISLIARKKIELYNALQGEAKALALIKQSCTLTMRPPRRGGILERHGATYPWPLQQPPEATHSTPAPPSNQDEELKPKQEPELKPKQELKSELKSELKAEQEPDKSA